MISICHNQIDQRDPSIATIGDRDSVAESRAVGASCRCGIMRASKRVAARWQVADDFLGYVDTSIAGNDLDGLAARGRAGVARCVVGYGETTNGSVIAGPDFERGTCRGTNDGSVAGDGPTVSDR